MLWQIPDVMHGIALNLFSVVNMVLSSPTEEKISLSRIFVVSMMLLVVFAVISPFLMINFVNMIGGV